MTKKTVIAVEELTKKFGNFTAVDRATFEVHRGEIFGFLGPNGSGKTTSIRMMLGLLQPTEGDVEVLGIDSSSHAHEIRSRIGYMSQKFSLYNDLTVLQNLNFYGASYGLAQGYLERRITDTLEMAGLVGKEQMKTKDLSGGWRQRLALGVAILHEPEVIFLDEPTAGVDPVSRRAFWDLLYDLVKQDVTVFVTTHYMDEAEHCQRLAFILDGQIIAYGSLEEIKASTFSANVLELSPDDPAKAIKILSNAIETNQLPASGIELYGAFVHVFSEDLKIEKKVSTLLNENGITIYHYSTIAPSLEDVFIGSVRKNSNQSRANRT
jgi:ABC-2 type transport system ATP-binding protein